MKIVVLLGSPRQGGNSSMIAERFLKTAVSLGAETEAFELNRLTFRGCQGCYACKKTLERCILDDDLTPVLDAVKDADLVVMASPVYFGDVTSQLKGFIDRSFSYFRPDYVTNPKPSRLSAKKLLFVLTQGHPDETIFADIFPRYRRPLARLGFEESRQIRICGIGPHRSDEVPAQILAEAEQAAREMVDTGK